MSFNAHPGDELFVEAIQAHVCNGVWTSNTDGIVDRTTNVCILSWPLASIMSLPRLIRKYDPTIAMMHTEAFGRTGHSVASRFFDALYTISICHIQCYMLHGL
jgi:hypothetical protein